MPSKPVIIRIENMPTCCVLNLKNVSCDRFLNMKEMRLKYTCSTI